MEAAELKKFLEDNAETIKAQAHEKMVAKILEDYRWEIGGQITKIVNEFMETEIAPEIKKHLQGQKSVILQNSISGISEATDHLAKHMGKTLSARMENSWQFSKIMKAMFD